VTEYADVPPDALDRLRSTCLALPEVHEQQAWAGTRWRIRRATFAHVLTVDGPDGPSTHLSFRSSGEELDALLAGGHPFYRAGWGTNVVGMVLDDRTDWDEVAELVTDSYCLQAPKRLAARVDRPPPTDAPPPP
jgi:predicted DNA-binding protein (MmcQ/YjbR family)